MMQMAYMKSAEIKLNSSSFHDGEEMKIICQSLDEFIERLAEVPFTSSKAEILHHRSRRVDSFNSPDLPFQ